MTNEEQAIEAAKNLLRSHGYAVLKGQHRLIGAQAFVSAREMLEIAPANHEDFMRFVKERVYVQLAHELGKNYPVQELEPEPNVDGKLYRVLVHAVVPCSTSPSN